MIIGSGAAPPPRPSATTHASGYSSISATISSVAHCSKTLAMIVGSHGDRARGNRRDGPACARRARYYPARAQSVPTDRQRGPRAITNHSLGHTLDPKSGEGGKGG